MTASPPVFTPPVASADVAKLSDRFRCAPYNCVITAGGCIAKRRRASVPAKQGEAFTQGHRGEGGLCQECSVGERLERALGADVDGGDKAELATLPPDLPLPGQRRGRPSAGGAALARAQAVALAPRQVAQTIEAGNAFLAGGEAHVEPTTSMTAPSPESLDAMVAEIRHLQAAMARNAWRMGRLLGRINEDTKLWKAKYGAWGDFTERELQMTGGYAYRLIDLSKTFSEAQVESYGSTKLIKILPVPKEHRAGLLRIAKTGTVKEVRAAANLVTLDLAKKLPLGARIENRDTGRAGASKSRRVAGARCITHVDAAEQVAKLFIGKSSDRAMTVDDSPRGWVNIGGKVYILRLRNTPEGLVIGVKESGR